MTATDRALISDLMGEYRRYRLLAEGAMAQMPDEALNYVPTTDCNSVAMIVAHMSGNLQSRFTDFLTVDGEKPWRERDEEFADRTCTRAEVMAFWTAGWAVVEREVGALSDADLSRVVTIRQHSLTVHAALCRSIAHVAYHVGQIVLLARITADKPWDSLSIPKGKSVEYNQRPTREKAPT
ncbi:MAG: hypothetical protein JWL61_3398 [Gemmatimonadetes bacterium]|nr:hypothetical protein [Gemmatimonadota bacterium]